MPLWNVIFVVICALVPILQAKNTAFGLAAELCAVQPPAGIQPAYQSTRNSSIIAGIDRICNTRSSLHQPPRPGDWILTRRKEWPFLNRSSTSILARSGSYHASGWRNMPGIPVARQVTTASLIPDLTASSSLFHKFGAVSGDLVVAGEFWFVPTAWPPRNSPNPANWQLYLVGRNEQACSSLPQCNGRSRPSCHLQLAPTAVLYRYRDYASAGTVAGFEFGEPISEWDQQLTGSINGLANGMEATRSTQAGTSNTSAGVFLNRPHQIFVIGLLNAAAWIPKHATGPASRGAESPDQTQGIDRAWDASSPWENWKDGSAPNTILNAIWWDGMGNPNACARPGFVPPFPGATWNAPPAGTATYGGHDSTSPLTVSTCAAVGNPPLSPANPDPCIQLPSVGDQTRPTDPEMISQVGYNTMSLWWKPCPACMGNLSCDAAECTRNITHLLQRRVVQRDHAPSPALLHQLRLADQGAYDWYECWSSSSIGQSQARPQCSPICDSGTNTGRVAWRAALQHNSVSTGGLASRSWLMAWTGQRADDGIVQTCVQVSQLLFDAITNGLVAGATVSAEGSHDKPLHAASRGQLLDVLLSPWLSEASTALVLDIPALQLQRVSREAFLLELEADIADTVGAGAGSCVTVTCIVCPAASNSSIWLTAESKPSEADAATASPYVRLVVTARFPPSCQQQTAMEASAQWWLVDARAPTNRNHDLLPFPVVMTGAGRNRSWLASHPAASAMNVEWTRTKTNTPARSSFLSALTLSSAAADMNSSRVIGTWLVWANPAIQTKPARQISIEVLCLDGTTDKASLSAIRTTSGMSLTGIDACSNNDASTVFNGASIVSALALILAIVYSSHYCGISCVSCQRPCAGHTSACYSRAILAFESARFVCLAAAVWTLVELSEVLSVLALALLLTGVASQLLYLLDVIWAVNAKMQISRRITASGTQRLLLQDSELRVLDDASILGDSATEPAGHARDLSMPSRPASLPVHRGWCCAARQSAVFAGEQALTQSLNQRGPRPVQGLLMLPRMASIGDMLIEMSPIANTARSEPVPHDMASRLQALTELTTMHSRSASTDCGEAGGWDETNRSTSRDHAEFGAMSVRSPGRVQPTQPPPTFSSSGSGSRDGGADSPRPLFTQTAASRIERAAYARGRAAMARHQVQGKAPAMTRPVSQQLSAGITSLDIRVDIMSAPRQSAGNEDETRPASHRQPIRAMHGVPQAELATRRPGDEIVPTTRTIHAVPHLRAMTDPSSFQHGVRLTSGRVTSANNAGMRCVAACTWTQNILVAISIVTFVLIAMLGSRIACDLLEPWVHRAIAISDAIPPTLVCSSWPIIGGAVARRLVLVWVSGFASSVLVLGCLLLSEASLRANARLASSLSSSSTAPASSSE